MASGYATPSKAMVTTVIRAAVFRWVRTFMTGS
jgi:hypothetical protein